MLSTDLADLRKHMAENPGGVIEDVAREKNVTARAVIEALPDEMRSLKPGRRSCLRCRTSRHGAR